MTEKYDATTEYTDAKAYEQEHYEQEITRLRKELREQAASYERSYLALERRYGKALQCIGKLSVRLESNCAFDVDEELLT